MRLRLCAVLALAIAAAPAFAQGSFLPTATGSATPVYSMWSFSDPVAQLAGNVTGVSQLAVPLRARATLGRWTFDAGAAFASSSAKVEDAATGESSTFSLGGLTDLRLRASAPIAGDGVVLTIGVNVPTGATKLDADETSVLQLVGAPALRMPVPALGVGFGATLGAVVARQAGAWALAFGASVEERSEYTPIEIALTGATQSTAIDPGLATRITFGADRSVGAHRFAMLLGGDLYTKDVLSDEQGSGSAASTEYTLGPAVSALARIDIAAVNWRQAAANLSLRHRTAFKDADGAKVEGSNGTYLEASLSGVRGGPYSRGLVLGADAIWHSGVDATDALVGVAAAVAGVTVGMEFPMTSYVFRITARAQAGSMDTGVTKFSATGLTLTAALGPQR